MAFAKSSISIRKPVDEVFDFILDGENNNLWRPAVTDVKNTSGKVLGVGTTFIQGMKGPFGKRISGDYEIIGCEKNKLISFKVISGPARPTGKYEFEYDGTETRVTFALSLESKGFARLMDSMITKQMQLEVANLSNMKTYLESLS
ncbi:SRPBCC family protein [Cohnella silvisoli]|uniref:SRPBCC family protein n=1 Tax=Cohnella silvisoli TaxID=2873699 RepID=A0ABV1L0N1_9BACL|nr:SRPBCC family protein [Cohnella silvisoli]MCD9025090.1 SRPBCC family protein [Cohnella silvisoli]